MKDAMIRLSRPSDINTIVAMDRKCYFYPLSLAEWKEYLKNSGQGDEPRVVVVEFNRQQIGYLLWQKTNTTIYEIVRLGVVPAFRRHGVGTLLDTYLDERAKKYGINHIKITVPAIHCRKGEPDDVSEFLGFRGFKATGEVVPDFKQMYGEMVEGYVFQKGVDPFGTPPSIPNSWWEDDQ